MIQNFAPRYRPAALLGLGAVVAGLAALAIPLEGDSPRIFLRVVAAAAAAGALLVLLPSRARRAAASLAILFHFGGILTAVTSVPPPGGPAPWLPTQLWTRIFRPYLQFMYLNNAYHFYSPDPGPPSLLWAHIRYADQSARWVRVPNRVEHVTDPLALSYYRRLALGESTNQLVATPLIPGDVVQRRLVAGQVLGIPTPDEISLHVAGTPQYRVPGDSSRRMLRSYARYFALAHPHDDPAVPVTGVKIYRVVHAMIQPGAFVTGVEPTDPVLYLPYYQGEYDRAGNLKDPADPFLYWLVPILRPAGPGSEVRDFLELHAAHSLGRTKA